MNIWDLWAGNKSIYDIIKLCSSYNLSFQYDNDHSYLFNETVFSPFIYNYIEK